MKYREFLSKIEKNNNDYISKEQLQVIFNEVYSNTTLKTFKNAIAILKNEQKIFSINNDYYSIVRKNIYEFVENKETEKIHNIINKEYPNINFIVWNTSVINEFTLHYSMRDYIIVETEKLSIELIVNLLKENLLKKYTIITEEIFNSNREMYSNEDKIIIVKSLHVKSPLIRKNKKSVISIEKIMLDLYKEKLYIQYQGRELKIIYENIFTKYEINFKRLLGYAKCRVNEKEYRKFLDSLNIPNKYKLKEE